jgi:trimeric autotransporter adhesin
MPIQHIGIVQRTLNQEPLKDQSEANGWLSMSEASKLTPYSAEYLSLLARKGKLASKKIDNTWYTTKAILDEYMRKQMLRAQVLRGEVISNSQFSISSQAPISNVETDSKIENSLQIANSKIENSSAKQGKIETTLSLAHLRSFHDDIREFMKREGLPLPKEGDNHIEKIMKEFKDPRDLAYADRQLAPEYLPQVKKPGNSIEDALDASHNKATKDVESALERVLDKKMGKWPSFFKAPILPLPRQSMRTVSSSKVLIVTTILTILILTISPVPYVFSAFESALGFAKTFVSDANTVMGYRPGTHANELLLLDAGGNIAITGHIETGSQLMSRVANGTAPLVVDSSTLVNNLNAEYLDGASSTDFTLQFVTKNGSVTRENVSLLGNVEVGQTLLVRGATKLLSDLSVGGDLSVLGAADFSGLLTTESNADIKGNLSVGKNIKLHGSLEAGGAIIGGSGSLGSLSVQGPLTATGDINLGNASSLFALTSKNTNIDKDGNASFAGKLTANYLALTGSATSTVAGPIAFGGAISFTGSSAFASLTVSGPTSLQDLTFRNATGTNATTTNFFTNKLSTTQSANGQTIFSAKRATDIAPSGDFITYTDASGLTPLFRVDNSGNIFAGGIANSGALTVTSTSTPQLRVQYDASDENTTSVSSAGITTYAYNGSTPKAIWLPVTNRTDSFTFADASSSAVLTIDTIGKKLTFINASGTNSTTTNATTTNIFSTTASSTNLFSTNLAVDGTTLFVDSTNHRVGIGITNPGQLLQLQSGAATTYLNINNNKGSSGGTSAVQFGLNDGAFSTSDAARIEARVVSNPNMALDFKTYHSSLQTDMTITQGNVGIGTTTPTARLQVAFDAGYSSDVGRAFKITNATVPLKVLGFGYDNAIDAGFIQSTFEGTGVRSLLLNPSGGNVGIGTTNPQAKLQSSLDGTTPASALVSAFDSLLLSNTSTAVSRILVSSDTASTFGQYAVVKSRGTLASPTVVADGDKILDLSAQGYDGSVRRTAASIQMFVDGGTPSSTSMPGSIRFLTTPAGGVTNTERMRIDNAGNVGIGTTSPASLLTIEGGSQGMQVSGSEIKSRFLGSGSLTDYRFILNNNMVNAPVSGNGAGLMLKNTDISSGFNVIGAPDGTGGIGVYTGGTTLSNPTEKMRVTSAGNVGVGVTNPGVRFQVLSADNTAATNIARFEALNQTQAVGIGYQDIRQITAGVQLNVNAGTSGTIFLGNTSTGGTNIGSNGGNTILNQGAGGNVGIGTTAPISGFKTTIAQDNTWPADVTSGQLVLSGATTPTKRLALGYDTTSNYGFIAAGNQGVAWSNLALQPSGGNVGIGVTNPQVLLQVGGASNAGIVSITSPNGSAPKLTLDNSATASGRKFEFNFASAGVSSLTLRDVTDSVDNMTWAAGGNVGIGTTSPQTVLHVAQNSVQPTLVIDNISSGASLGAALYFRKNNVSRWGIGPDISVNNGTNKLEFWDFVSNSSAPRMVIDTSGTVGIGITNPSSLVKLESAGIIYADAQGTNQFAMNSVGADFGFIQNTASQIWSLGHGPALNTLGTAVLTWTATGKVGIGTTNPGSTLEVAGPIRMGTGGYIIGEPTSGIRLNNSADTLNLMVATNDGSKVYFPQGNVGVGVASPTYKLDVFKAAGSALNVTGNSAGTRNDTGIDFSAANSSIIPYARIGLQVTTGSLGSETGGLAFSTINSGSLTEKMFIRSDGNVGIGTTNPGSKLTVNGEASVGAGTNADVLNLAGLSYVGTVGLDGTGMYIYQNSSIRNISIGSNSSRTQLVLDGGGVNVGIGTTNPANVLSIKGHVGIRADAAPSTATETLRVEAGVTASTPVTIANFTNLVDQDFQIQITGAGNVSPHTLLSPSTTGRLSIGTAGAESLSVINGGNVGIGITNPSSKLDIKYTGTGHVQQWIDSGTNLPIANLDDSSGAGVMALRNNVGFPNLFFEGDSGNISYAGSLIHTSDARLKENMIPLGSTLDKIMLLNPISYNLIGYTRTNLGFTAQNVQPLFPQVVSTIDDQGHLGVDYTQLISPIVGAIQELDIKVDLNASTTAIALSDLNVRLDTIEMRLSALENASSTMRSGLTIDATTTDIITHSVLATLGASIMDGLTHFGDIVVSALTVGSKDKPTGVTFFDSVTGEPYCMRVTNGVQVTLPGTCSTATTTAPVVINNPVAPAPPSDTASSTPDTASSTPIMTNPSITDTSTSTPTTSTASSTDTTTASAPTDASSTPSTT